MLSIVTPVYNTGSMFGELVDRIVVNLPPEVDGYEIIAVDDGSGDDSWQAILQAASRHPTVKGIRLSRNFGQHAAIQAGLAHSIGEWVVVMDSDLQDDPLYIPQLLEKAGEDSPIVLAKRAKRTDGALRRVGSRLFYYILSKLADIPADHSIATYGVYHRKVVDTILQMKETQRFFPLMVAWTGFPAEYVNCYHGKRQLGRSGYSTRRLLSLALQTTISYSDKPLRYIVKTGMLISLLSLVYASITIVRYFMGKIVVSGYASIIVSIWFIGGLILFTLGIVGLYVGRIFEQVKSRPLYIIKEETDGSNG